jgi:hypothetical protein
MVPRLLHQELYDKHHLDVLCLRDHVLPRTSAVVPTRLPERTSIHALSQTDNEGTLGLRNRDEALTVCEGEDYAKDTREVVDRNVVSVGKFPKQRDRQAGELQ